MFLLLHRDLFKAQTSFPSHIIKRLPALMDLGNDFLTIMARYTARSLNWEIVSSVHVLDMHCLIVFPTTGIDWFEMEVK